MTSLLFATLLMAGAPADSTGLADAALDLGFRQMYNLQFTEAHRTFGEWKRQHPEDPMGPASDAAAYLFDEFDRLRILQGEFFTEDDNFRHPKKLSPDPKVKVAFGKELDNAERLATAALTRSPKDTNALFAQLMVFGLRADYEGLVEKRYMTALGRIKSGHQVAEKLLAADPNYADAHLAIGVENYMLSLKPAPIRWLLQLTGAETDRQKGVDKLLITSEKGHYLRPYARLLIAVAALRDKNVGRAKEILQDLSKQFPQNRLYLEELDRLRENSQKTRK